MHLPQLVWYDTITKAREKITLIDFGVIGQGYNLYTLYVKMVSEK
jgi:hypothetical protein